MGRLSKDSTTTGSDTMLKFEFRPNSPKKVPQERKTVQTFIKNNYFLNTNYVRFST